MSAQTYLQWEAPQFKHYDKHFGWYSIFWIVFGILIFLPIIEQDYFGAFTVALIAAIVFFFTLHKPKNINVAISNQGIHLDNQSLPYSALKSFWIVDNGELKQLNLESTALLDRNIIIELADQNPEEVSSVLEQFIPQHPDPREPLSHRVTHKLRF